MAISAGDLFRCIYGTGEITLDLAKRAIGDDPQLFLEFVEGALNTLKPFELSFAAEVLGRYGRSCDLLLRLLQHKDPTVREGAVLGLAQNVSVEATKALYNVAANDSSSAVRGIAKECLGN